MDVPCAVPPNCGAAGFSGELEEVPNLKSNENVGFASFGASLGKTTGGLAGSLVDGVGVDCSTVDSFELSVEPVVPNPANGFPSEPLNANVDAVDTFCSDLVAVGAGSIIEVVEEIVAVGVFVDSTTGLRHDRSPNELSGG